MAEWITDRPPTAADGGFDGHVKVQARINDSNDIVECLAHWSDVKAGTPWNHIFLWLPRHWSEPKPTAELSAEPPQQPTLKENHG